MPHMSDSNYHRGVTHLSEPTHMSIHMCPFPLDKYFTVSLLPVSMQKFISTELTGQGLITGHWSLDV